MDVVSIREAVSGIASCLNCSKGAKVISVNDAVAGSTPIDENGVKVVRVKDDCGVMIASANLAANAEVVKAL